MIQLDVFNDDEKRIIGEKTKINKDFAFVPAVNRAPMWVNKELFERYIHHINFDLAPFQYDDYDVCIRAWLCGLQVGYYSAGFKSLSAGGMRLWNRDIALRQMVHNSKLLYEIYQDKRDEIQENVNKANQIRY